MFEQAEFLNALQDALDQPAGERAAFVHANSADPLLAKEVLQSLEEMENFTDFLERPAVVELVEAGVL